MNQNSQRIKVNLKSNPYEIVIGNNSLDQIGEELSRAKIKKSTKILIVTNNHLENSYGNKVLHLLLNKGFQVSQLVLKAGEDKKNIKTIGLIHDECEKLKLERGSILIALGGGVIGDMTGFAAATWLRGISFIQIPTTLLAMVDASIGGKTGVNHPRGKNLIGAFHQPKLVVIDPDTLTTLPEREFRAGMAEVIKYAVIRDTDLFSTLETLEDISNIHSFTNELIIEIISRSAKTKARIVEEDELEKGLRAILNYGHTFGHAIETESGYGEWLHGEAVSIGMNTIGLLAVQKKLWTEEEYLRQKKLLLKSNLPVKWPKLNIDNILKILGQDKKVQEGNIRFIVPYGIGKVKIISNISYEAIRDFLTNLNINE